MYKNTNILSYFKPFSQPSRRSKRSLPEENLEEPGSIRRSRSTTPEESRSKQEHDREGQQLEQCLHRTSSRVNSRSSSTQPPAPQNEQPMESAKPTQVFRHETSHIPVTPSTNSPISQTADILSSQCPSLRSSQRVVKNGEVVIRNSDDESDSETSLEDLDGLLLLESQKTQREPSCPELQLPSTSRNRNAVDRGHMSRRRRTKTDIVTAQINSDLPVQAKRYKFDLESLAKHKKQEDASTEDFSRASAMFRMLDQQKVSATGVPRTAATTGPFDATFIDLIMREHGDDDELSRLKAAIRRTEALNHDKMWSFFDEQAEEPLPEQAEFPVSEDDHLGRMLGKTFSRQQAFLSGYVGEFAMKERLPEEILLWIMDAICLEPRDDLRYSYSTILRDASKDLASILSPKRIDMLFRNIGATAKALDIEGPVDPYPIFSQSMEAVSRPNLLSILDLFQKVASILGTETRMHVICTLCRLALDHSVANNCHVISAIEDAFASLFESIPQQNLDHELQVVMTTAFNSITDATLRLRLLQNIPASSHRLILFRRRFALASFFRHIRYLSQHADNMIDLKTMALHLEDPQFIISNTTDYTNLAAAIGTLSIAIGRGDPPCLPWATEEEKAFNRDIDALSLKINAMFADIVDTGASHMGRTEAKEVLEAFQYWLSYGVRTKPPPKKALFGASTFHGIADMHMMEAFVEKGKQNSSLVLPDGVYRESNLWAVAAS